MIFSSVPISDALDKILGHNVAGQDGRRILRKGKPLTHDDLKTLSNLGRFSVYVAEFEPDDVPENEAAQRIATAVQGAHLTQSNSRTGRANLIADSLGLLRIDTERLIQLNFIDSVTLATLPNHCVVAPGQIVATLKIIAYGVPENSVREAEFLGAQTIVQGMTAQNPIVRVDPLEARTVSMILSGSPAAEERITDGFSKSLGKRLQEWGSTIGKVDFIPLEDESDEAALSQTLMAHVHSGSDLVILAGETAIMDKHDIAPRAVERAGGRITAFGAPVDPGNLLMLARHDATGRTVQIVGTPGCARSPKKNIVDLVIPRLLAGDYLTKMDIVKLGHGGMLDDVSERGRARTLS